MNDNVTGLEPDFSLQEVAAALGMSTRWVRDRCNLDGAEHQRYGHKIRFTAEQVAKLRARYVSEPAIEEPITTGKKKAS